MKRKRLLTLALAIVIVAGVARLERERASAQVSSGG